MAARLPSFRMLLAWICVFANLLWSDAAHAVQHLIRPGDDWQYVGSKLRPGDEIVLMPGKHRGAAFQSIEGTAQRPIVIRSADPNNPSIIVAEREGIRIRKASHVVIRNLHITGATISGINLGESETGASDLDSQNVTLQQLTILKTGPRGLRHAIAAKWISHLRIDDCKIEGWGGSAIELVGCDDVSITRCSMLGLHDHGQMHGIRARAGTRNIQIEECRIENAGTSGVCLGGKSDERDFRSDALEISEAESASEASQVRVQRCVIISSQCAISISHVQDCSFRNNTVVRPRRCVIALMTEQTSPAFTVAPRLDFGRNLIVWEPGDLLRLIEMSARIDPARITFDSNLWWSSELESQAEKLGGLPGRELFPQVMDVDPKLDTTFRPTDPAAAEFGH